MDALSAALEDVRGDREPYRARAEPLLRKYVQWPLAREHVIDREAEFVVRLPAGPNAPVVRIRGSIDRIDETPDGVRIWDYKTGRADADHLRGAYALQLRLYAYAAEHALGHKRIASAGLIALDAPTAEAASVIVDTNPKDIKDALQQASEAAAHIAGAESFVMDAAGAHAGRPCAGCEYRGWCPDARPDA